MNKILGGIKSIYGWLIDQKAFSGLVSTFIVVVVLAPLSIWAFHRVETHLDRDETKVCLQLNDSLKGAHFWLRHVRDSPGTLGPSEPLFNRDIPFPSPTSETIQNGSIIRTCVVLTFPHRAGVQFKPFLDFEDNPSDGERLRKALQDAGFRDVVPDGNPGAKRWWFLLPQFQIVADGPSIRNNYFNK